MVHPVFIQAFYYGIVIVLMFFMCGALQRGFFWKYLKVRTSFGKLIMVKIRTPLRDYFATGWYDKGFLCYKDPIEKKKKMLSIDIKINEEKPKEEAKPTDGQIKLKSGYGGYFYKCLNVNWVDIDEETNALAKTNYSAVPGYDAIKFSDLLTRALMRPSITSGKEKLMVLLLFVAIVASVGAAYLGYQNNAQLTALSQQLPALVQSIAQKAVVVGSSTTI